jgi:hypothetical protein
MPDGQDEGANAALVHELLERAVNQKDMTALDELSHPDAKFHSPLAPESGGLDAVRGLFRELHTGFPDFHLVVDDTIAVGDVVVVRWHTDRQTHLGPYRGIPPTGRKVRMTGIEMRRIRDGRVFETFMEVDALGGVRQMGVVPPDEVGSAHRAAFVLGSLVRFAWLELRHKLRA